MKKISSLIFINPIWNVQSTVERLNLLKHAKNDNDCANGILLYQMLSLLLLIIGYVVKKLFIFIGFQNKVI